MNFQIEFDREDDGRWIADIPDIPGVIVSGATKQEAESKVQALALRVIAAQLKREQSTMDHVQFAAA